MFQILQIATAQVKAGNNSSNLLYEIRKTIYFLYQSKAITKQLLRKYTIPYLNQYKYKNGYYIYEL